MAVYTKEVTAGQAHSADIPLSQANRRLLLGTNLRLLGYRFVCGKPIFQSDLIRAASLADDVVDEERRT